MKYTKLSDISDKIDEAVYWIALQDNQYLLPTNNIIDFYIENKSLKSIYNNKLEDLLNMGVDPKLARKFINFASKLDFNDVHQIYNKSIKDEMKIVKYVDEDYPVDLRKISNPPILLFKKGRLQLSRSTCIAMAGTRDPSNYGRMMSRKIAFDLAREGFTIVSGLAHGIDEWAHNGALEAKGDTIAVLAWMNPEYPPEHHQLLLDIVDKGAIISEIFTKPDNRSVRGKFIQRNRITSGISNCVIAVESDEVGGTVHQVKIALGQKKLVFALKPKSNRKALRGFKTFKDLGAIPVVSSKDIITTLRTKMAQSIIKKQKSQQVKLDTIVED